jgi:solute:Na+ symporter, SSS family
MILTALDSAIILLCLAAALAPALWMMRRGGRDTAEFFTSGRAAPWWLIGVSMVATTFSTDTPNLVTNLVREGGIAANWVWWAFLLTGMTTVFFYARLWRRLGLTDLEFYELRYSGAPARRCADSGRSISGWCSTWSSWPRSTSRPRRSPTCCSAGRWADAARLQLINVAFAATSGLWGVLVADFVQFGIAMTGSFAAVVYALGRPRSAG